MQRVADQRMADRNLVEMRQRAEEHEVVEVEVVAGIHAQAEAVRQLGGGGVAIEARLAHVPPAANARAKGSV